MLDCLILGDSIAVGLSLTNPSCISLATVGISTDKFLETNLFFPSVDLTIISLGSNDFINFSIEKLEELRNQQTTKYICWILPLNNKKANLEIKQLAKKYNDSWLDLILYPSNDGIHPLDYKLLDINECL